MMYILSMFCLSVSMDVCNHIAAGHGIGGRDSRKSRQKNSKKHGTPLWKSQKSRQFV